MWAWELGTMGSEKMFTLGSLPNVWSNLYLSPLESSENLMISGGIEGKICIDSATICGVHVVANIIDYLYKDFTEAQVFIAVLVWFLGLPRSQHNCICHFLV